MYATSTAQAEFSDLGTFDFNLYRQVSTYRGKTFQEAVIAGNQWDFLYRIFFILPNNYLLDNILYFVCVVTSDY